MSVQKMEVAGDIIKLHYTIDDIEEQFSFNRNEWVQWLMSQLDESDESAVAVFGNVNEKKVGGYIVMIMK
jgi:hypothetical protein